MKLALLSLAAALLMATPTLAEDFAPCVAPLGEQPTAPGITLTDVAPVSGDLPALRATSDASGAFMMIHYDAVSERAARSRAACLGAQLAMLEQALGDDRRDVQWSSVAFVADPNYVPPRGEGLPTRWTVHVAADGSINADAQRWIVVGMPHEQTHLFQNRNKTTMPRWFDEGHASWVEMLIAPGLQTTVAAAEQAKDEQALATSAAPLALGSWGGVRPRLEAILRQLSPEDRARMEKDPSFSPPGPFSFGPGDLIGDESNMPARYAAAWKIFDGLAARHGVEAVKAWVKEISSRGGRVTNADIVASAKARFGEDLGPLLA